MFLRLILILSLLASGCKFRRTLLACAAPKYNSAELRYDNHALYPDTLIIFGEPGTDSLLWRLDAGFDSIERVCALLANSSELDFRCGEDTMAFVLFTSGSVFNLKSEQIQGILTLQSSGYTRTNLYRRDKTGKFILLKDFSTETSSISMNDLDRLAAGMFGGGSWCLIHTYGTGKWKGKKDGFHKAVDAYFRKKSKTGK